MKKPNLIYIMADQMRRDALGFEGVLPVKTPVLDQFARESLVFNNVISTCPLCTPYRALLFTGKYPLSTGMVTNCQSGLALGMSEHEECFTDVLKESGYQTAYIGKWHLDNPSRNGSVNPEDGACDWDGRTSPESRHGVDFWYAYNAWNDHFNPHYWTGDNQRPIEIDQWSVDHETDVALTWLEAREQDEPFALFLSWNPPHPPYVAPDNYLSLYPDSDPAEGERGKRRRSYYAAVSSLDFNFGRLLDWLDKMSLLDNTIVVFTADHGDMLGDHGQYGKTIWYKESLEVPFILGGAEKLRQGSTDLLMGSADIMPTLLSLMDLPVPQAVQGLDLSQHALMDSGTDKMSTLPAAVFFGCYANPGILQTVGQEPTAYTLAGAELQEKGIDWRHVGFRGIRTARYTLVVNRGNHTEEVFWSEEELKRKKPIDGSQADYLLYDRKVDPNEQTPRISHSCDTPLLEDLAGILRQMLADQGDPFTI